MRRGRSRDCFASRGSRRGRQRLDVGFDRRMAWAKHAMRLSGCFYPRLSLPGKVEFRGFTFRLILPSPYLYGSRFLSSVCGVNSALIFLNKELGNKYAEIKYL